MARLRKRGRGWALGKVAGVVRVVAVIAEEEVDVAVVVEVEVEVEVEVAKVAP